jgi:hypothetical protein
VSSLENSISVRNAVIIERAYFGVDGEPLEVKGACRIVYTYNTSGKAIKTDRFDAKGKLVP